MPLAWSLVIIPTPGFVCFLNQALYLEMSHQRPCKAAQLSQRSRITLEALLIFIQPLALPEIPHCGYTTVGTMI